MSKILSTQNMDAAQEVLYQSLVHYWCAYGSFICSEVTKFLNLSDRGCFLTQQHKLFLFQLHLAFKIGIINCNLHSQYCGGGGVICARYDSSPMSIKSDKGKDKYMIKRNEIGTKFNLICPKTLVGVKQINSLKYDYLLQLKL